MLLYHELDKFDQPLVRTESMAIGVSTGKIRVFTNLTELHRYAELFAILLVGLKSYHRVSKL